MAKRTDKNLFLANMAWGFLILIALIFFCTLFIVYWEVGYDSDMAIIGLMARDILFKGDRPIFVWSVGYMGVLLEAYLTAVYFKLFGVSPVVLNFAPLTYFLVFVALYVFVISRAFDRWVAYISTLLLVVSSPYFYRHAVRTCPNYVETLMLGMLIFVLYSIVAERREKLTKIDVSMTFWLFSLGFVTGFATYTVLFIILFIGAVLGHACLLYFRKVWPRGAGHLLVAVQPQCLKSWFVFLLGYVIGHSPSYYYRFWLGGTVYHKSVGGLSKVPERFVYFVQAHSELLNISHFGPIQVTVIILLLISVLLFIVDIAPKFIQLVAVQESNDYPLHHERRIPLLLLYPITFMGFLVCESTEPDAVRYLLPLVPFYSLTMGWTAMTFWRNNTSVLRKSILVASLLLILGHNTFGILDRIENNWEKNYYLGMVSIMEKEGLKYGYGGYWFAYCTSFLAQERIIIEPTYSRYNRQYRHMVAGQKELGLFCDAKTDPGRVGDTRILDGFPYKITKTVNADPRYHFRRLRLIESPVANRSSVEQSQEMRRFCR